MGGKVKDARGIRGAIEVWSVEWYVCLLASSGGSPVLLELLSRFLKMRNQLRPLQSLKCRCRKLPQADKSLHNQEYSR